MNGIDDGRQRYVLLYVAPSATEVARRYLSRLCRLRDEGFEVHVAAGDDGGFDDLVAQGIIPRPLPLDNLINPAALAAAYLILQGHILETRPILVHSFGHQLGWISTFAAHQAETPATFVTMDFHWMEEDPLYLPLGPLATFGVPQMVRKTEDGINTALGPQFRRIMRAGYRWLADRVDRYLVTTEFDFQLMQDLEIVAPEKLEILIGGAGVDLDRYATELDEENRGEQGRRQLGLPKSWRQVLGWVGPLSRRHGADDLIATIEEFEHTHPALGWVVVLRDDVEIGPLRKLRRLAEAGRVHIVAQGQNEVQAFRAMDLLVWIGRPSTPHDAILEAAAMAVPTVGFETPAANSFVEQGQTGVLITNEDTRELYSTLARVLGDPRGLRQLGIGARSRAGRRFDRRDVDEQVLALYDSVLESALTQT